MCKTNKTTPHKINFQWVNKTPLNPFGVRTQNWSKRGKFFALLSRSSVLLKLGYFILRSYGLVYGSFLKNKNLNFFFLVEMIRFWLEMFCICLFPLDQMCLMEKTKACMWRKGGGAGGRVGEMPPALERPQLWAHSCTEPCWAEGPFRKLQGCLWELSFRAVA